MGFLTNKDIYRYPKYVFFKLVRLMITLSRTPQPETCNLQRERSLKPGELFL